LAKYQADEYNDRIPTHAKDTPPMKLASVLTLVLVSQVSQARLLDSQVVVELGSMKGQTYFTLMKETVKPKLDAIAKQGFTPVDGKKAVETLSNVGQKVGTGAMRAARDNDTLAAVADGLNGQTVNFYDLPEAIGKVNKSVSRFDLTTYLALASGAGVAIEINDKNTFYNVNYGAGDVAEDEMTGRSFSETPLHKADDISDKSYLKGLEDLVRGEKNQGDFFSVVLQGLVNCDFSGYAKLSDLGQSVATDFFAIYTAEQDRHMMSGLKTHPWDEALLEVTLLSSLHGGQDKIALMVSGEMKDVVENQVRCGQSDGKTRDASLIDYWQFTTNPDPKACGRSGINITRKDFRALGLAISQFEREQNPEIVANVERHFTGVRTGANVFAELSADLISDKAPRSMGRDGQLLVNDMLAFLEQVRKDANQITSSVH
jgi:hypothetical protein